MATQLARRPLEELVPAGATLGLPASVVRAEGGPVYLGGLTTGGFLSTMLGSFITGSIKSEPFGLEGAN